MAIFEKALNPFGKVFGDMSPSGKNNAYANSIMFNAMGNRLAEGRNIAAANNLSYGGVDDQGEHIFAPAGVYQPMQEAAEGILGLLDSRPLPPANMGLMQQEGPRIFPPTHGDPLPPEMLPIAPIDPEPSILFEQPIHSDPFKYAQPDTLVGETGPRDYGISQTVEDPIYGDPQMIVQDEVPAPGYIEDELAPGAGYIEDPVAFGAPMATATPIGQPIDTGTNPFYTGATNVAQPPSMTPVAPSFSLDVGVGGYGTPTNTPGFGNYYDNLDAYLPSTSTPPEPTPPTTPYPTGNYSDQVALVPYPSTTSTPTSTPILPNEPQTTTTALPTVNSFAGFNGFGGFGGF